MLVLANLLSARSDKATYLYGPDRQHLNGVFHIDFKDIDKSHIKQRCKNIEDNWAMRLIVKIIRVKQETNSIPKRCTYANGD